ncbi:hypothetical protein FRUB_05634 [Fimbriiglobus ruber]|uniref:Uncharacterized protein n=1 Tax=Fimbriiglobus ruber TaxID=1908690 RepID=A0A225DJ61_9BACT|nr:hypothetical protein FRUB_05634 [Fimbriiglobus ruber]
MRFGQQGTRMQATDFRQNRSLKKCETELTGFCTLDQLMA